MKALAGVLLVGMCAAPAAGQRVAAYGRCMIGEWGEPAPVTDFVQRLCGRTASSQGAASGREVVAAYSSVVESMIGGTRSLDSTVCVALRCARPTLRGLRFVVQPDSVPNAYEVFEGGTAEILFTTALLDMSIAAAATIGTDLTRRLRFPSIFGAPTDPERLRYTAADSGALSWVRTLSGYSGRGCHDVPRYNYPFMAADSGLVTAPSTFTMAGMLLAHELAHIESDSAKCGYRGTDPFGIEAACDSIALSASIRVGGTPLLPIGLYVVMGHVEAFFQPVYSALSPPAFDPAKFREIRDWRRRADVLTRAWRADSATNARFAWMHPYADTLLAVPLPSPCVQTVMGRLPMWAPPKPAEPERPLTREEARASLTRMDLKLNAEDFGRAISSGWTSTVALYLRAGMNPNATDTHGVPIAFEIVTQRSIWCIACGAEAERVGMIRTFLSAGGHVNAVDERGATLLMAAIDSAVIRALLDGGADVRLRDREGRTALMHAASRRDTVAARLLIRRGARVNDFDRPTVGAPQTPLLLAGGDSAIVSFLLAAGAAVDQPNKRGETPLVQAAARGHSEVARLLLVRGANPNHKSLEGRTPIMEAITNGHAPLVRVLAAYKAQVNARWTYGGETLLMKAVKLADSVTVAALLEAGADVHSTTPDGRTALDAAKEFGRAGVLTLLQRAAAKR